MEQYPQIDFVNHYYYLKQNKYKIGIFGLTKYVWINFQILLESHPAYRNPNQSGMHSVICNPVQVWKHFAIFFYSDLPFVAPGASIFGVPGRVNSF